MMVKKAEKHGVIAGSKLYEAGMVYTLYDEIQAIQRRHRALVQSHSCYESNLKKQSGLHCSGKPQVDWKNTVGGDSRCGVHIEVLDVQARHTLAV